MKKLVEEVKGEGLESLLGKEVVVWCMNYIYTGTLIGVQEADILLTKASVVYETGPLSESGFTNAQELPTDWYVRTSSIESYGEAV